MAGRISRDLHGIAGGVHRLDPAREFFVVAPREPTLLPKGSAVAVLLGSEGIVIVRP